MAVSLEWVCWSRGIQDAPYCHCGRAPKVLILNRGTSFKGLTCKAGTCGGYLLPGSPGAPYMWNDSLRVLLQGFSFCILEYSWINVVISITRVAKKEVLQLRSSRRKLADKVDRMASSLSYFLKLSNE